MTREELKQRLDDLSDEEVEALASLFGPSEDERAASSESLQAEIEAALKGELPTVPLDEVLKRLGLEHVPQCTIQGCPGEYEERKIAHVVRHGGEVIVFDSVPAQVCGVCGDVLLEPETVRRLEKLLELAAPPTRVVPLYEYA